MFKIDFIICGVQKSGTELLSYYLRQHPKIKMPEKELHYFDTLDSENDLNYNKYHKQFSEPEDSKIFGEKTPIYIFYKDCLEKIAKYNNDIKIILIFRDPFDRALSAYNMELARGNENLSFDDAIFNENQRIKFSDNNYRNFSYLNRGYYFKQLKKCFSLFNKDQIQILNYDNLMTNFNDVMVSVQKFLSCNRIDFPTQPKRVTWANKKKDIPYKLTTKKFFVENLYDDYQEFKKETGFKFHNFENNKGKNTKPTAQISRVFD
jgi:hypothetical protein